MKTALVVDDHDVFRSIIKKHITACTIIGEAADYRTALDLVKKERPDLVILDVSLTRSEMSIIQELTACHSAVRILVLTLYNSSECARLAFEHGASGYCSKDEGMEAINGAIASVLQGKTYISPLIDKPGQAAAVGLDDCQ